jgi:protein-tyrosine phosphatase
MNTQEQERFFQDGPFHRGRRLPFKGLLNTRELGGYPVTVDGKQKQVKCGVFYRSGSPESINATDKKILESLGVKTVVDFRSEGEKQAVFDLASLVKKADLPIDAGNLMGTLLEEGEWRFNPHARGAEKEMLQLYAILPVEAIKRYRVFFSLLADPANMPVLFHCSAGKDRTGLAAALLLHALGAGRQTIMEDYLYSSEYLRPYWEQFISLESFMVPYYTVKESYLEAALRAIDQYGGIDSYLTTELGVDVQHLRNLYTETPL